MAEGGVPIIEVTANDFMQVRAALVKRVGGANQALVFSRVYYRTGADSRAAIEVGGEHWWQASHALLAKETGLSEKQSRDAIEDLVERGFVLRESHAGRVYSYRPIVIGYLPSGADAPDEVSAPKVRSIRPEGQMYLPSGSVAPLIDIEDIETSPSLATIEVLFEQLWTLWPAAKRVTRKKSSSSWRTAVKEFGGVRKAPALVAIARQHVEVWETWPASDRAFIPMLTTWLNQCRWETPLPERRGDRVGATVGASEYEPGQEWMLR